MRRPRPPSFFVVLVTTLVLAAMGWPGTVQNVSAQSDTARWTPELTMRYDQITDTEISRDGKHVAYVVREAVMERTTSTFRRHVHVAAVDGSFDAQYTRGEHSNFTPKWSPSGDRLAFLSTRGDGPPQVYLMRTDGGEAYAVTDAETGVNEFQWRPDGNRLAYTMTDPKSEAEKQREKEKRDVHRVNEEFRYAHLYTTEVKPAGDTTRSVQRLTGGDLYVLKFDWAPDGETIAFAHIPVPLVDSVGKTDLSTVPADSGAVESLVERPGRDLNPRYSPDGKQVAFESMAGTEVATNLTDLWTVPAEGGTPTKVSHTPNRQADPIGWTRRGGALLVEDVAGTSTRVYAVPADGDSVRRVTSDEGVYEATSYSRSADRLALTYQNSATPAEVYVGRRQNFDPEKITRIHEGVPRPKMGRTELVTWAGPGGQEIEGLLTYPVGYDGGPVPLVLNVHGGPTGTHLRSFTGGSRIPYMAIFKPQVFAERGYAMLRPNPHGSDGYGLAFREAIIEDWGGVDYEDLMAGVDKMIEMGVAHPDSLVIAGGSYGGYMTAWTVTQTDRFEAASMYAGLSNLISVVRPGHLSFLEDYMGGPFWARYETYEASSPIYHVEGVETPTQILHGAEDERVPPSQGREFYRALRQQGVPTEMILYPRMPHFPREPKLINDMAPRMLDWFDEHLGRGSAVSCAETSTNQRSGSSLGPGSIPSGESDESRDGATTAGVEAIPRQYSTVNHTDP